MNQQDPAPRGDLAPGAVIGRYVIERRIGAGGMGVVYAAHDPQLDRRIALKLLNVDEGGGEPRDLAATRLLREARAMAKLSHPNVITVHDVGTIDGQVFIAMELVQGGTLGAWLSAAPRSWREVLDVFRRAGEGLGAAHAAGLVHRDFKPDNVLVDADGRVRVLDFGLARAVAGVTETRPTLLGARAASAATSEISGTAATLPDPAAGLRDQATSDTVSLDEGGAGARGELLDTPLTATGALVGTPRYMAPEQFTGGPVDPRTDQFSFCVALYEGLYGSFPFPGPTLLELMKSVTEGKVAPSPKNARVPGAIRRVLLRGLRVDPAERHPSMEALLGDLDRAAGAGRRQWLLGMGGVAALAVAGGALRLRAMTTVAPSRVAAVKHRRLTFRGNAWEPVFSPDGTSIAYLTGKKLVVRDVASEREREIHGGREPEHLAWLPDGTGLVFHETGDDKDYVVRLAGGGGAEHAARRLGRSFSPDGTEMLLFGSAEKGLLMRGIEGEARRVIWLTGEFRWLREAQWSPSGRWFLVATSNGDEATTFWIIRSDGADQRKLVDEPRSAHSLRWAPREDAFYYVRAGPTGTVDVVKVALDPRTGTALGAPAPLLTGLDAVGDISVSPDGRRFAYTRARTRTALWLLTLEGADAAPTVRTAKLDPGITQKGGLSASPDGRHVAFGQAESGANVFTLALDGGPPKQVTFLDGAGAVLSTAWSPDGSAIAFTAMMKDGVIKLLIVPSAGGEARPLGRSPPSAGVGWCASRGIVYQTKEHRNFQVLDPVTGDESPLLPSESGWLFSPSCSPEGTHAVFHWNRDDDQPRGLWLVSFADTAPRLLAPDLWPLGYGDGGVLYAHQLPLKEILRVPADGGAPVTLVALPFDKDVADITVVPGGRRFACTVDDVDADIWMAEDFDPEIRLP